MKRTFRQASGLTGDETRASLLRFNWSAGLRGIFDTIGMGTNFIFVGFARSLGVAKEQMGWLSFIVSGACLLQMAVIPLIGRIQQKKRFALSLALTEPFLVMVAVGLALLLPPGLRLVAFVAAVFMAAASAHMSRPITDDWFASTIPTEIRGRYLGRRLRIVSIVTIITTYLCGIIGDRIGMDNTVGLGLLLIGGACCGVAAVVVLRDAPMPALAADSQPRLADFMVALNTRPFARYLILIAVFNIPFFFAVPYYQVFHLEIVKMPASLIAVMQSGYFIVKILALPFLGRLVDRWGPRKTMYVSGVIYAWFFSTYMFCGPGRYWPILVAWAVVALADAAFGLAAQFTLFDAVPNSQARPVYFATSNIVTLSLTGLGGVIAVPLLGAIKNVEFDIGPFHMGSFHLLYGACALAMIPCLFAARLVAGKKGPEDRDQKSEIRDQKVGQ